MWKIRTNAQAPLLITYPIVRGLWRATVACAWYKCRRTAGRPTCSKGRAACVWSAPCPKSLPSRCRTTGPVLPGSARPGRTSSCASTCCTRTRRRQRQRPPRATPFSRRKCRKRIRTWSRQECRRRLSPTIILFRRPLFSLPFVRRPAVRRRCHVDVSKLFGLILKRRSDKAVIVITRTSLILIYLFVRQHC